MLASEPRENINIKLVSFCVSEKVARETARIIGKPSGHVKWKIRTVYLASGYVLLGHWMRCQ